MIERPNPFPRRTSGGFALLMVLPMLLIAMIVATTFVSTMGTAARTGRDFNAHTRARMIAESGLEAVMAYIRDHPEWRAEHPSGTWVTSQAYAGGTFTVAVEDGQYDPLAAALTGDGDLTDDLTDAYTVTSTGTFDDVTHMVRSMVVPQYLNTGALALDGPVSMSNYSAIDGWDSSQGSYGGDNAGLIATATTNSFATNSITMTGHATILGDALVGPGATLSSAISQATPSMITGDTGVLPEAVELDTAAMPATLPPLTLLSTVLSLGTILSDARVTNFTLIANQVVTIDSEVTLVCTGNFNLGNNSQLRISPGGSLTLYVGGSFTMEENAVLNGDLMDPTKLNIYKVGAGAITISNSARMYAMMRAPSANMIMDNYAEFFGTFHGNSLTMSNYSKFHEDLNTAAGLQPQFTGFPSTWIESR